MVMLLEKLLDKYSGLMWPGGRLAGRMGEILLLVLEFVYQQTQQNLK
jgi:hypothetical protein